MSFGKTTYFFESLPSTNDYASELLSKEFIQEGTIVETAYQSAGHGQQDRVWYSLPNQNITLSLILKPHWLPLESQFLLNLMVSLAILKTVEKVIGIRGAVKWPNDVYVNKKKISGILIKNQIQGSKIQSSIIGIGLNVLQEKWPETVTQATSLKIESHNDISISNVKAILLQSLEELYTAIQKNPSGVIKSYNQNLYLKNTKAEFNYQGQTDSGIIRSIDAYGSLLIEKDDEVKSYAYGEITFQ